MNARRHKLYVAEGRRWVFKGESFTAIEPTLELARQSNVGCAKAEGPGRRFQVTRQTAMETWR